MEMDINQNHLVTINQGSQWLEWGKYSSLHRWIWVIANMYLSDALLILSVNDKQMRTK